MAGASRVKGIAIELSIDGSKVTKWLQQFFTEADKAQRSLKDLEKSLKLNPTNTDLIKQKFDVMREAIDKTKDALDKAKQKMEELSSKTNLTDKETQQFRNLQREISDTEVKLRDLQREYRNLGSVGAQEIKAVGGLISDMGSKIVDAGTKLQTLAGQMERLSAPFQALFGSWFKDTIEYEQGMKNVQSVTQANQQEFEDMWNYGLEWAKKTKFTAEEVSEGYYYAGLAGAEAAESMQLLPSILDLAAASDLDTARTSEILMDTLLAMGQGFDQGSHYANVFAAAMSNSDTTTDLLGETFKYVAQYGGALDATFEDLILGIASFAQVGVKGSQAGTGMRMALANLTAPTEKQAAAMRDNGIELYDMYGKAKPLRELWTELREQFGGLNLELVDSEGNLKTGEQLLEEYGNSLPLTQQEKLNAVVNIFGKRALPGILGLINSSEKDFNDLAWAIDNADLSMVKVNGEIMSVADAEKIYGKEATDLIKKITGLGTVEAMRETRMSSTEGQLIRLRDNLSVLGIELMQGLLPYVNQFIEFLSGLIDKFRRLDPETQQMIMTIAGIIAVAAPLVGVISQIIIGVGSFISVIGGLISGLGTVIGVIQGIISIVGAGPALIVAAVVGLTVFILTHLEEFCAAISEIWNSIKEFAVGLWEGIKWMFEDTWNAISQFAVDTWNGISQAASDIWNAVKQFFTDTWNGIKEKTTELWTAIKTFVSETWTAIKNKVTEVVTAVKNKVVEVWTNIKTKISELITAIKNKISEIWDAIKTKVSTTVETIKSKVIEVWTNIKTTVSNLVEGLKNTVGNIWDSIKTKVSNVVDTLKSFLSNAWSSIKSTATNVWNGIKNAITKPIETARNTVKGIIDKIKGFFPLSIGKIFSNFKLPHISVTWKSIAGIVDIPTFSIDWYAKAMKNGMLLDGATIFGAANGQLLGGGEAGKEWIVGQNSLMSMIQSAVGNNGIDAETIYNAVVEGMRHSTVNVYMDGKKVTNIVARQIGMEQAALNRYYGG